MNSYENYRHIALNLKLDDMRNRLISLYGEPPDGGTPPSLRMLIDFYRFYKNKFSQINSANEKESDYDDKWVNNELMAFIYLKIQSIIKTAEYHFSLTENEFKRLVN